MNASPFSLAGKHILVTGASAGIGAATARLCARLGGTLYLSCRDGERLDHVLGSLEGSGHAAFPAAPGDAMARRSLADALPALDACVFAAPMDDDSAPADVDAQQLDAAFRLNVDAPLALTRTLLAADKIRNHASLVYLTGTLQHWAFAGSVAGAASQAALGAAVRALAVEIAARGIRANCVAPGPLETAQPAGALGPAPLGAIGADDVAGSIAYLLAPASRWVSRTSLVVDGGLSLHVR